MKILITDEQALSSLNLAIILIEIHEMNYNEELEDQLDTEIIYKSEILA